MDDVLVTGGAGFIGRHLCEQLLENGCTVTCLDNFHRFPGSVVAELRGQDGFTQDRADIRDRDAVADAVEGADTVFHLAAVSRVKEAEEEKEYAFETNVEGTWNVLTAARERSPERVVFASSREVYGDSDAPVPEDAALGPHNMYGISKMAGDLAVQQADTFDDLSTVALRLANVYGPGDRDRVIPTFFQHAEAGEEIVLYGGDQVLDFVWIDDVIDAFLAAARDGFPHTVMNVGSGDGTSIRELAERIVAVTGSDTAITEDDSRSIDTQQFVADTNRMEDAGVQPTRLEDGLKRLYTARNSEST